MNKKFFKIKKNKKYILAKQNIDILFNLLENNFFEKYEKLYIKEILNLSKSFNIRLKDKKLLFCRNCYTYFNCKNRKIRFNSKLKTKEIMCQNCNNIKRFKYK